MKRLESLGYVDKAVEIPLSIAPDTESDMYGAPLQVCPYCLSWGALFSGHEVNPLWWGLYNWVS